MTAGLFANLAAWEFQRAVETLRRGFVEAVAALDRLVDQKGAELLDYEASLRNGAEPIGEWEDGVLLWDQAKVLGMEIEELERARMALRKAIVIQLYHLWERTARGSTGGRQADVHEDLVRKLRVAEQPVHDRLEAVGLLANTLKHGNPKKGAMLADKWPEVLSIIAFADWYDRVVLSDDHVEEVAEIIVASGPRMHLTLNVSIDL